mgnify:CR=1 FL=1
MKLLKPILMNKTIVDMAFNPVGSRLHSAMDMFVLEGTVLNLDGETSLASMSFDILNTMGITMIDPMGYCGTADGFGLLTTDPKEFNKNYSFINGTNNDEGIDNPNISDPDINALRPKKIEAGDKFIAPNDPFYEQDDELPDSIILSEKRIANLTKAHLISVADKVCLLAISINKKDKALENKYLNSAKKATLRRSK